MIPELSYPYTLDQHRRSIDVVIPPYAAYLLGGALSFLVVLIAQVRVRSFWDVHTAFFALRSSLVCACACQVIIKWLIGGLRPYVLDYCDPDTSLRTEHDGVGFHGAFFTRQACRGNSDEPFESFPSGHATATSACAVFLFLYLNAKLKVFANYRPAMWKLILVFAPLLASVMASLSLVAGGVHHPGDVVFGTLIGVVFSFYSYRIAYAAVWDWRYNHIPLHGERAFKFVSDMDGADDVATRAVGWGLRPGHPHAYRPQGIESDSFQSRTSSRTDDCNEDKDSLGFTNKEKPIPRNIKIAHPDDHGQNQIFASSANASSTSLSQVSPGSRRGSTIQDASLSQATPGSSQASTLVADEIV